MEEEKKLYPFKIIPIEEEGSGATVLLADLGYPDSLVQNGWLSTSSISEIMEMYMDRVVGEDAFAYYGRQFPVMLRHLGSQCRTPLLVHPDDTIAAERFDFLGKAKLWYVKSVSKGGRIALGFRRDVGAEEFYMACRHNCVEEMLNVVEPHAGESFFIAPGTVHAALGGVEIIEVAQSSPLDFRLCEWGEKVELDPFDAELGLEAAFDFIDYRKFRSAGEGHCHHTHDHGGPKITRRLTDNPEFTVTEVNLTDPLHIYCEKFGSFVAYVCLGGSACVEVNVPGAGKERYVIGEGETLLVPAEVPDFFLVPLKDGTILLETISEKREEIDSYTLEEKDHDDEGCGCGCEDEDGHECGCGCHHHHHHEDIPS